MLKVEALDELCKGELIVVVLYLFDILERSSVDIQEKEIYFQVWKARRARINGELEACKRRQEELKDAENVEDIAELLKVNNDYVRLHRELSDSFKIVEQFLKSDDS